MARLLRRSTVLVAVALLLAGCGGNDNGGTIQIPAGATSLPATTTPPDDVLPGASTTPVSVPPSTQRALLSKVTVTSEKGFDRVVFEFEDALPGYKVAYVDKPVHQDGSGFEVPLAGSYALAVRMESAGGGDLSGAKYRPTYTGPARIKPKTAEIAEVARSGDFEGVLTWVIGTADKADFRVSTVNGPSRLIVDVRAGNAAKQR